MRTRRLAEDGWYYAADAADHEEVEGCEYYEYDGSNVEGGGVCRAEEYYEGDRILSYVYMPDVDNALKGQLGGDPHPSVRRRGLPSFPSRSLGLITGRATQSNAGILPENVSRMVAGLAIILASLPAALGL